ncbi:MAG: cytochrome c oxidase accessory protein CcoG [Candidatus Neomarinimicrobiota bacterium]|nr:MAG: cytochrome c oxidase accessory protein CcoG [Candidatus Neomarinimicrobiota bacterium]
MSADSNFRDRIATVNEEGKRVWIYPKKPSGRYYRARTWLSWLLLAVLFAGPFITIGGRPAFLLNILDRKFYILGISFWPQDMYLFGLGLIILILFIILFTAVFGRIFCGWICPQTIFMEMVFRKIEYWIEGDARQQRKLNAAPWTGEKVLKKGAKWSIFYGISFLIGNTFLAYIIGKDALFDIITDPPSQHLAGLTAMIVFSFVFFGVFAWFREQVCILVCPYGRLQGVLLDPNSIVVHYDFVRGEPRGKGKRTSPSDLGDCVDCHQCVDVCPTGIDIRDGTQLECVNCTACMDACDSVMDKMSLPRGLIRYASYNSIRNGVQRLWNARVAGYSAVLVLLVSLFSYLMATRSIIDVTVLRSPGVLYQRVEDHWIRNLYTIDLINKSDQALEIELEVVKPEDGRVVLVSGLHLEGNDLLQSAFFVDVPEEEIHSTSQSVTLGIKANGEVLKTVHTNFLGPVANP